MDMHGVYVGVGGGGRGVSRAHARVAPHLLHVQVSQLVPETEYEKVARPQLGLQWCRHCAPSPKADAVHNQNVATLVSRRDTHALTLTERIRCCLLDFSEQPVAR